MFRLIHVAIIRKYTQGSCIGLGTITLPKATVQYIFQSKIEYICMQWAIMCKIYSIKYTEIN